MNRRIRRTGLVIVTLFLVLFAQAVWLQVFSAERLYENQANTYRQIVAEYEVDRGNILARDGKTRLAFSQPTGREFDYIRRYPAGDLFAPITGFYSLVYGRTNLEQSFNPYLSARSDDLLATNIWDQLLGKTKQGASIVSTIDDDLQRIASQQLQGRPGAVAAIDPRTGDVLALVSVPSYDPNALSSHEPRSVRKAWDRYNSDPQKPMVSKANQELYPPGSTFKIITASAALENGYGPESTWPNPPALDLPQSSATLQNFGGSHCNGGSATITLQQAFTQSCNVTFGEIGLELGANALNAQAEAYGFNQDIPFQVPLVTGNFPEPSYFDERQPAVALSAIGQDEVSANPMQMAMAASAIANGGVLMQPRLVSAVIDPAGREIQGAAPAAVAFGRPISSRTAAQLTTMMVQVVESGTGTAAQIQGISVAGKTGTAQHGQGLDPHAWFVGFAPAQDPKVAVAVVVLDGGDLGREATGGAVAAPIAKAVMQAALEKKP